MPWIFHSNRVVIHPDYCGLGLGLRMTDACTSLLLKEHPDYKIMARFSSVPMKRARDKSANWKMVAVSRKLGKERPGGTMDRQTGFRDQGVTTWSYEWVGDPDEVLKKLGERDA